MTRHWLMGAAAAIVGAAAMACGGSDGPDTGSGNDEVTPPSTSNTPDAGIPDSGTPDAGGLPDSGTPDAGSDDGGMPMPSEGPWPTEAVLNYTDEFDLGYVQSLGVDDAHNIWLLNGERIGVLRPGTTKPVWVSNIGQAAPGFGPDKLATNSTVICGGEANRAYVGYAAYDPTGHREDVNDPLFMKGDMDVVQLNPDGTITLTEHLHRSAGTSQPWPPLHIGIRNTNDWHYDEDMTVLTCVKVMKGPFKGEVYIGTNHGVTRIRGLTYNSHRHPIWMKGPSHQIGYSYGLGIAQDGEVLIANEWMIGILTPPPELELWDNEVVLPWALKTNNHELNSIEEFDFWRGFQQTTDGKYYVGSSQYGLWEMTRTQWTGSAHWAKVSGLPTEQIDVMQATDDGSLFIGTHDQGLWRMDGERNFSKVPGVSGHRVRQLVYDPTVSPSMLYVVTNTAVTVLRGH